jgi:hypothetical protein
MLAKPATSARTFAMSLAVMLAGCAGKQGISTQSPGATKQQDKVPLNDDANAAQQAQSTNPIPADAKLLHATYDINVVSLGLPVCKGDIEMQINAALDKSDSAQLFEIPSGKVKCTLMGEIDLAQTLGAFSSQGDQVKDPMVVENDVIHMKQIGKGKYSPARPMLPSFIASSKKDLASLDYTKGVTITQEDGKTASGNVNVHTLAFGASHQPPRMNRTFKNVLHFETVNTGFQGVDKVTNLLFDRMEFKISLSPISILYVSFKGKVADYQAAAQSSGIGGNSPLGGLAGGTGGFGGGGLFGMIIQGLVKIIDVEMQMNLVKQEGLDKTPDDAGGGDSTDGEVVGDGDKSSDED